MGPLNRTRRTSMPTGGMPEAETGMGMGMGMGMGQEEEMGGNMGENEREGQ